MLRVLLSILATLCIFFIVPFPFYATLSAITGEKPPEDPNFMLGVIVQKVGHATVFVLLLYSGRAAFRGRWLLYAAFWWVLFITGEIGMVIGGLGPVDSWPEAGAGILSEAVYFPLAAFVAHRMLIGKPGPAASERDATADQA